MSDNAAPVIRESDVRMRPRIDVAYLPSSVLDHRSPVWVGNLVLVLIETAMFCILLASYFYLRKNFHLWPPPVVDQHPPIFNPLPPLGLSTLCLLLQVLSIAPMLLADRRALHMKEKKVELWLLVTIGFVFSIILTRWFEFLNLPFRWDLNAYTAVVWTILGLHSMHLLIALGELVILTVWLLMKGLDKKHARDVRVAAVYWYWVVGTWIPIYLILYIGPRL